MAAIQAEDVLLVLLGMVVNYAAIEELLGQESEEPLGRSVQLHRVEDRLIISNSVNTRRKRGEGVEGDPTISNGSNLMGLFEK